MSKRGKRSQGGEKRFAITKCNNLKNEIKLYTSKIQVYYHKNVINIISNTQETLSFKRKLRELGCYFIKGKKQPLNTCFLNINNYNT